MMILSLCFQKTIYYDEFYSLNWCGLDWKNMMEKLVGDVHPPLYYIVLKIVLDLTNNSIFAERLLSFVFCLFFLWYGSLFIRKNFNSISALFFTCFVYFNPFMIQKAAEIRMYTMGCAFAVISGSMAYYILKRKHRKDWIIFTISSLVLAYIQYYGILAMCFLYGGLFLAFLVKKDLKNLAAWIKCSLVTIVGYLPWLPTAIRQITSVNDDYWIEMPSSRLGPLRELFYSEIPYTEHIYLILMICLVGAGIWIWLRRKSMDAYWMLICNSAVWGTLIFSILYASYKRPILVSRYLIIPFSLAALGMCGVIRHINKYIVVGICLLCIMVGSLRYGSAFRTLRNEKLRKPWILLMKT